MTLVTRCALPGCEQYYLFHDTSLAPIRCPDGGPSFVVDHYLHRKLRSGLFSKRPLTPFPEIDKYGRWDLRVRIAGRLGYFSRPVALFLVTAWDGPAIGELVPPTLQSLYHIDPKSVDAQRPNTRDCRLENLQVVLEQTNRGILRKGWTYNTAKLKRRPSAARHVENILSSYLTIYVILPFLKGKRKNSPELFF